ncbi:hypothetical protein Tco_1191648 [Tanacetum coccineum]
MGRNCFVRLDLKLWGFKASILLLISTSWDSWDFLDQRLASIDEYRNKCDGVNRYEGVMWRLFVVMGCRGLLRDKGRRCGFLATMLGLRYLGEVLVSWLGRKYLDHCGACLQN